MITLLAAIGMWSTWWLTEQFQPLVNGFTISPIPIAVAAKVLINLPFVPGRISIMKTKGRADIVLLYGCAMLALILVCVPVAQQSPWLTQIGYTIFTAGLGVGYFAFACFSPQDLQETSHNPDRPLKLFVGIYSIHGLALVGIALTSTALIHFGNDAVWVFAMSIGSVVYFYVLRAVTLAWRLTQQV